MADLEQIKKSWKVLDENLQKTEIINKEQIKKIAMEKIQTTFDTWRKRNKYDIFIVIPITLIFAIKWFLQGFIWQPIAWVVVIIVAIIIGQMQKKEINAINIQTLSVAELSRKIEHLQLRNLRGRLLSLPFIVFLIYLLTSVSNFELASITGFAFGALAAFVWGYFDTRKKFATLRKNIQELNDLQSETD